MNQRKGAATHLAKYTEADAVTQRVNLRRPVFNAVITAVDRPAPRPLQRRPAQCRSCASHTRALAECSNSASCGHVSHLRSNLNTVFGIKSIGR